jgi:hypothetical protein
MTTVQQSLTFPQFLAASRLYALHTTVRQKVNYFGYLFVLPIFGAVMLPFTAWIFVSSVRSGDGNALISGLALGLFLGGLYLLTNRLRYRARMRKLYKAQSHELPHIVEFSDEGIHTTVPGLMDARFEWAFFESFIESTDLLLFIRGPRSIFVAVAKSNLDASQEAELRTLLNEHLRQISI